MKKTFRLEGLDCAVCASKIEDAVRALDGVTSASVNFVTAKLIIESDYTDFAKIMKSVTAAVKKLGMDVVIRAV